MTNYGVSLQGIQDARCELERAGRRIARAAAPLPGPTDSRSDSVDIKSGDAGERGAGPAAPMDYAVEAVNLSRAKTAFKANLMALEVESRLDDETIDILG